LRVMGRKRSKSSRTTKKYRKRNFGVFLLLCIILLIGFMPLSFDGVENIVAGVLKDAGADSVSVGKAYITVFKGIQVENLSTYKRRNSREYYRTKVSSVSIVGNVFGLAAVVSGGGKKPSKTPKRDIFLEVYDRPVELLGEAIVQLPAVGLINKIELNSASVRFINKDGAGVSADGVSVKLYKSNELFNGHLTAKKVNIPHFTKIENFNVKLKSNGKNLDFFDAKGKIFDGKFRGQVSINPKNSRIVGGNAHISGLDIQKLWTEMKFASGHVSGKFDSDVEIEGGTKIALESIKLKGKFSVNEASAVDLPLQNVDMVSKISPKLKSVQFQQVTGDFRFLDKCFEFDEIVGTGDVMKFRSVGWLELNGRWEQNFEGEFSKQFMTEIPSGLIKNSLGRTDDGGGRFRCKISQTFEKPRVKADKSMYKQVFKNIFKKK